ncbi:6-carboxytetrahydropterin synthase QueD [Thermodesulfovibrionales bacterium]|nr:6-carboxytetrahydropterin synthase QueD [Thermodesulfovibrionales bacterium]MCL0062262.1 6-carboxytetrahydropterin synthase QueD [Thermodesulfovibrionales bacterium]MCL0086855.1 6-carboxytetrahydropterin synthase QueD [Thermodesulfovibrionales bacterium]
MYELMVETGFASAHTLKGYKGKCENLHGHNWRVQVYVTTEKLNELDIAIDFHDLKKITGEVVSQLDHKFLNEVFPFTERNPSSENIARWIFDSLKKRLMEYKNIKVSAVAIWESETASATYYEKD